MTKPAGIAKLTLCWLSLLFVASCGQKSTTSSDQRNISSIEQDTATMNPNVSVAAPKNWIDSLLENYIALSKNELVRSAVSSKLQEEWLFDQVRNVDTVEYLTYQIGHDVAEEDGSEPRFITDQWVYVDTAARALYEYDLPNDSLVRWSK